MTRNQAWEAFLNARADLIVIMRDVEHHGREGSWEQIMLTCNVTETQARLIYEARKGSG